MLPTCKCKTYIQRNILREPQPFLMLPEIRAESEKCSPMTVHRVEIWHNLLMAITEPQFDPPSDALLTEVGVNGGGPMTTHSVSNESAESGTLILKPSDDVKN